VKAVAAMSLAELAAWVSGHLQQRGIPVVMVGGGCVSVYSENRYQTSDLDFVERYHTRRQQLRAALAEIGFEEETRYFRHPEAAWFLEFPPDRWRWATARWKRLAKCRQSRASWCCSRPLIVKGPPERVLPLGGPSGPGPGGMGDTAAGGGYRRSAAMVKAGRHAR
jgi:hypothetical protein